MTEPQKEVSAIIYKRQATVPQPVRQTLGADYGSKVVLRVDAEHKNPAIDSFLSFLAQDIQCSPYAPVSPSF